MMDDILAKKNRHLFLEEKDNQNNSFIGNVNTLVNDLENVDTVADNITDVKLTGENIESVNTIAANIEDINNASTNIDTVKTFNDNVNNGTMQYLLEAFTTSLNEQGNAWEVRLTQLGESILATTSAFNYSTVVTVSSDIPANGTLMLPNSMKYKVGTHMLMVSWNGTVCYAGDQYDEVGAYGVWATSIKLNQPAKAGDKIQLRIVALTDQSSYVDITEAAINASQFVASGSNTERYLPEFLGDVVNVKNFGAVGNGVNDDTTAFQSAIASGKAVFIPEGTYKLSTDLNGVFCGVGNSIFTGGTVNGSTILRGVAKRNNDIINVKDYGAKGDGTTDDTEAFQTAATIANGQAIFVPQGSYSLTENVSGFFFTDGIVDTKGTLTVFSLKDMQENFLALKVLPLMRPSNSYNRDYAYVADHGYQSICYDTKREVFYLGYENTDNTQNGYIYTLTDILDPSSVTATVSVAGGHFNCMDYDAVNDKIWLAPGSSQQGYVRLVEPSDLSSETLALDPSVNYWQLAVDNAGGFVYTVESGYIVRYKLSTKTKDTAFTGIPLVTPKVQADESTVGQGMFFYNGMVCFVWNVYQYSSGGAFKRAIFTCHDIATRKSLSISHAVFPAQEVEDCTIKDGVLYELAAWVGGNGACTVFATNLDTIDTSGSGIKWITTGVGFNNLTDNGVYLIPSGDSFNAQTNGPSIKALNALVYVQQTGKDGKQLLQTVVNSSGEIAIRAYSDDMWHDWMKMCSDFCITVNYSASVNNAVTAGLYEWTNNLSDLPVGTNGFIKNWICRWNASGDKLIKQFYCRQGTTNTNDHNLYFRSGSYNGTSGTWTFSTNWYRIITSKDTFPNNWLPDATNTYNLGSSSLRWKEVFSNSGSINTSDARVKENISEIDDALFRAWSKVRIKIFQMKNAVEKKGKSARIHAGVVAQEVQAAFASEGLDAGRYGFFCYDEWGDEWDEDVIVDEEAVFDENGNEITPAKTHVERVQKQEAGSLYSIRYSEALALECAYQRWLGEQRDAKIEALMQRISALENNQ